MKFNSQKEMFQWIWDNRERVSEISGLPLLPQGHPKWSWQFAHVLGKGAYPGFKLRQENIMLMLPQEHENQETFDEYRNRHDSLRKQYYKEFYGKEF